MGSVKDLQVIKQATTEDYGTGRFIYSDRYSVFDWGEMPDRIPNKGASITILGAYFFEKLESMGISTHYIGLVENDNIKKLNEIESPLNTMQIKLLRVIKPKLDGNVYDYSEYKNQFGGFLIPLEVIYRNYLPPGSSVFKRLRNGEIKPHDLGLEKMPEPNQKLMPPILDVSTKLEITDRYMNWKEAQGIAGMSDEELVSLKELISNINKIITDDFSSIGLINEDGKIEAGFDKERKIMLVDVFGTLDECRFTYDGIPVSKEIARIYYRNTDWNAAVEKAKKKDRQHWKEICELKPEPLSPRLRNLISQVYSGVTNEITKREWFKDVPPLKVVLKGIKDELGI
jgi:phosphoribosylaminoimidazole-succinocarboxamide synthase